MNFCNQQHRFYCGVDLHARSMYVCILDQTGETLLHRNLPAEPGAFLRAIDPYRQNIAVAVECIFTWYWLADLCRAEGIPFAFGYALYMKAIHTGKARNDRIDSRKIAALLRSGMFPQAYVYPAEMPSRGISSAKNLPRQQTRDSSDFHSRYTSSEKPTAVPTVPMSMKRNFSSKERTKASRDLSVSGPSMFHHLSIARDI